MRLLPLLILLVCGVAEAKGCDSYNECMEQGVWDQNGYALKAIAIELHEIKDLLKSREK